MADRCIPVRSSLGEDWLCACCCRIAGDRLWPRERDPRRRQRHCRSCRNQSLAAGNGRLIGSCLPRARGIVGRYGGGRHRGRNHLGSDQSDHGGAGRSGHWCSDLEHPHPLVGPAMQLRTLSRRSAGRRRPRRRRSPCGSVGRLAWHSPSRSGRLVDLAGLFHRDRGAAGGTDHSIGSTGSPATPHGPWSARSAEERL